MLQRVRSIIGNIMTSEKNFVWHLCENLLALYSETFATQNKFKMKLTLVNLRSLHSRNLQFLTNI